MSQQWWCQLRCAWVDGERVVETDQQLAARRQRIPDNSKWWIANAIKALLAASLLLSCRPSVTVQAPGKLDVRVTEMPARAGCYLPDPPHAPAFKELDFDEEEILRRTMVHYLEFNAVVQWSMEMQAWAEDTRRCLAELTGQEP